MATRDKDPPPAEFTTNEEDQREAAKLQARLKNHTTTTATTSRSRKGGKPPLPSVEIAQGAHKYVLIRAQYEGKTQFIVTSRKGAHYHRNAADPMIFKLEEAGYSDIEVEGGGRIFLDEKEKKISVFGHSYGFGQANHAVSQMIIKSDERYKDFDITISDDGY